jgi:hypothetical protein
VWECTHSHLSCQVSFDQHLFNFQQVNSHTCYFELVVTPAQQLQGACKWQMASKSIQAASGSSNSRMVYRCHVSYAGKVALSN